MVCTWKERDFPYRDWVVRLNDNLPFDEFITWQLRYTFLDPTLDQKIATGFVRMNSSTKVAASRQSFRPRTISIAGKLGTSLLGLSLV